MTAARLLRHLLLAWLVSDAYAQGCRADNCLRAVRKDSVPGPEDCEVFLAVTVSIPGDGATTTTTTTRTVTLGSTVTVLHGDEAAPTGFEKRMRRRQATVYPSEMPAYATNGCKDDLVRYASACSCLGVLPTTTTVGVELTETVVEETLTTVRSVETVTVSMTESEAAESTTSVVPESTASQPAVSTTSGPEESTEFSLSESTASETAGSTTSSSADTTGSEPVGSTTAEASPSTTSQPPHATCLPADIDFSEPPPEWFTPECAEPLCGFQETGEFDVYFPYDTNGRYWVVNGGRLKMKNSPTRLSICGDPESHGYEWHFRMAAIRSPLRLDNFAMSGMLFALSEVLDDGSKETVVASAVSPTLGRYGYWDVTFTIDAELARQDSTFELSVNPLLFSEGGDTIVFDGLYFVPLPAPEDRCIDDFFDKLDPSTRPNPSWTTRCQGEPAAGGWRLCDFVFTNTYGLMFGGDDSYFFDCSGIACSYSNRISLCSHSAAAYTEITAAVGVLPHRTATDDRCVVALSFTPADAASPAATFSGSYGTGGPYELVVRVPGRYDSGVNGSYDVTFDCSNAPEVYAILDHVSVALVDGGSSGCDTADVTWEMDQEDEEAKGWDLTCYDEVCTFFDSEEYGDIFDSDTHFFRGGLVSLRNAAVFCSDEPLTAFVSMLVEADGGADPATATCPALFQVREVQGGVAGQVIAQSNNIWRPRDGRVDVELEFQPRRGGGEYSLYLSIACSGDKSMVIDRIGVE